MKSVAILATLPLVAYALPTGSFSYKPDSDKAPNSWPGLAFGEEYDNQCGGSKQSGIDIPTHTCDVSGDYIFSVSPDVTTIRVLQLVDSRKSIGRNQGSCFMQSFLTSLTQFLIVTYI